MKSNKNRVQMSSSLATMILIIISGIIFVSCNGCSSNKQTKSDQVNYGQRLKNENKKSLTDTTSQVWKDQHYYRSTYIPLPDSLKRTPGLGTHTWFNQKKYEYRPIEFDDANDPNATVTKIHFMDSLTKKATNSLIVYEQNPYKDLPFDRISGDRLMKVDGIIRYDLSSKTKAELRPFLMGMGVNIDTVNTKIVRAEVMTGNNSPEERTALANSYAIQVVDEDGNIISNQTTYKIYDRYGKQTGEIKENGHGLYQFAITKDGKHLAASFGGRYGCRSGQYIKPYFKIFKTINGEVIHHEAMEFSDGVTARFNYFTVSDGGPFTNRTYSVYLLDFKNILHLNFKNSPSKYQWKENFVKTDIDNYFFKDSSLPHFQFSKK